MRYLCTQRNAAAQHCKLFGPGKGPYSGHGANEGSKERTDTMKHLIARYRAEATNFALYRKTRDEIAMLPRSVAIDLGLFPEDADRIAREAVWG